MIRSYLALVVAALFWAGNYVVGQRAVETLSPASIGLLRWVIAVVPLLVIAQLVERPRWRDALRHWPRLVVLSLLGLVGYNLFLYYALEHTTAVAASLINAVNPALIALFAALFLRQRLGGRGVAGLVLGLVGVVIVITGGDMTRLASALAHPGTLLMVGAILVFSVYTLLQRGMPVQPITSTSLQAVVAVIVMTPVALLLGLDLPGDGATWTALLYIGIFPSVGSYVLWNGALRGVPASAAGIFLNLITVFTVLISLLVGERIAVAEWLGGAVVIGGVVLMTWPARRGRGGRATPVSDARSDAPRS